MGDIFSLVSQAGLVVKFVLFVLLLSSIFAWTVIFTKYFSIKSVNKHDFNFLGNFWNSKSLDDVFSQTDQYDGSAIAHVFKSGFKELQKLSSTERSEGGKIEIENIQRALFRASTNEVSKLERHVGWLATIASAAPFIGLFGTVWGIMNAFQGIGATGNANLAVVAPGISEALIATAVGLAAAIPAVVAYNHFVHQIRKTAINIEGFIQDFLNIVQRGLITPQKK